MACNLTITVPDATAVVKDQAGNTLATENIPSGESQDITVEAGGGADVLYTYPYASFNTGQNVQYAVGDDKWVRDNVINTEIATWPSAVTKLRVYPSLNGSDPTLLEFGCNPDGSGDNIFGNKERFTNTAGAKFNGNNDTICIDHYTGQRIAINNTGFLSSASWLDYINYPQNNLIYGESGFYMVNNNQASLLMIHGQFDKVTIAAGNKFIHTSTTTIESTSNFIEYFQAANGTFQIVERSKTGINQAVRMFAKPAFTYNSGTGEMELI